MINATWGITQTPFKRDKLTLLYQQKTIVDIIKIHAQQGGFSVVVGEPGVGKTVLREHIETFEKEREFTVVSCSRTLHTYRQIAWQLAESFKLEPLNTQFNALLCDSTVLVDSHCAVSHMMFLDVILKNGISLTNNVFTHKTTLTFLTHNSFGIFVMS